MSKQIKHTSNGTTYLLVEVPENSEDFIIENGILSYPTLFGDKMQYLDRIKLPTGNWSIVGMGNKMTDEQYTAMVGYFEWDFPVSHIRWIDYNYPHEQKQDWLIGFSTSLQSFQSLLSSNNLKLSTTLILKNNDTSI